MIALNEIVNIRHIRIILEQHKGERQLQELKSYFLTFHQELREIGIDPSTLAWQIYTTNKK